MNILLDTHAFIWWDADSTNLSSAAYQLIKDDENTAYLSVVSVWEIRIKTQLGKLSIRKPLDEIVRIQRETNAFQILAVTLDHALKVGDLPLHHKDPFDRMLAAQAIVEDYTFITKDAVFMQYPVKVMW